MPQTWKTGATTTATLIDAINLYKEAGKNLFANVLEIMQKYPANDNFKPQELIDYFILKWGYTEIGAETPELFEVFLIRNWAKQWARFRPMFEYLYGAAPKPEVYENNKATETIQNDGNIWNNDRPVNRNDAAIDNATNVSGNSNTNIKTTSGYSGRTASEMLDDWLDRQRNLFEEFSDGFTNIFLYVKTVYCLGGNI